MTRGGWYSSHHVAGVPSAPNKYRKSVGYPCAQKIAPPVPRCAQPDVIGCAYHQLDGRVEIASTANPWTHSDGIALGLGFAGRLCRRRDHPNRFTLGRSPGGWATTVARRICEKGPCYRKARCH